MTYNPAIVQGNTRSAIALFIEDERGDLVDIHYVCMIDAASDPDTDGALLWPAYDFGDSQVRCIKCNRLIQI